MNFLNELKTEANFTKTENGAGALKSTMNALLDAFGSLAAMKDKDSGVIIHTFAMAFAEDRANAMRLLFYVRDIRGGQGMRRVFRVIWKWLAQEHPEYVLHNLENVLEFGRGDDFLCLYDTPIWDRVVSFMNYTLMQDMIHMKRGEPCSLLAKWMPSENASSKQTKELARDIINRMHIKASTYRRSLSKLRAYLKVVEQKMSAQKWDEIDYEKVPAKAAMNYSDAFARHDESGYTNYLIDLANGDAKINAKSLFPVDIVHKVRETKTLRDRIVLNAMWESLPNYLEGKDETGICVVDVSGSMSGLPIEVAVSLGLYCADKCKGPFKNHFITFTARPELVEVSGADIVDKVRNTMQSDWGFNTNLEAVFDLLLATAIRTHAKQSDMPQKLYIISDMQFDEARCTDCHYRRGTFDMEYELPKPFMRQMRAKFARAGYELPSIVYWNVRASECGMFQETFEGENCCMVSGYSPSLFSAVIEGTTYEEVETEVDGEKVKTLKQKLNPIDVMMAAIGNERYDRVWVG